MAEPTFTYAEVGATLAALPAGYHHLERSAVIGRGDACFERVSRDILAWQVQRRSGIRVEEAAPTVTEGGTGVLRLGIGPLALRAPVRVVHVVAEPDRVGFAYGTLPGHPERGEELFVVRRAPDGTVSLDIRAFSRPATLLSRAGGPAGRLVQRAITRRYLRALS
ncbi:DUF1990 domain-containing protein [Nocardioides sp. KIGAM211]|uniref:DUF1990 domain-containing protein n=1 Tax=Nocardioides luti TaxID=2761101 RepID=A0A7X0VAG7_9ACTN|nr:DUF1990 domain-containing protein [Nocardioides luti]MBB6626098.1 DUF1990 domain-containing protein [Nocardioides luti]